MNDLFELLRRLGMRLSREALDALLTHAQKSRLSPAQMLEQLCTIEQRERDARNLARRVTAATIGPFTPLDKFDWNHPRSIDRSLYEQLLTLDFLGRGENVLLRGQAGVGKTTLAQNLGLCALERGHTVRFVHFARCPRRLASTRVFARYRATAPTLHVSGSIDSGLMWSTWLCGAAERDSDSAPVSATDNST